LTFGDKSNLNSRKGKKKDLRRQDTEVGRQETEVRSQETEVRSQETEVRSQKAEGGLSGIGYSAPDIGFSLYSCPESPYNTEI